MTKELDRDMDTMFDSLNVLNVAMTAIMQNLPSESAAKVVHDLDESIAGYAHEPNPPEGLAWEALLAWRNRAAKTAGFPPLKR